MTATTLHIVQRTRKSSFYEATIQAGVKAFTVYNHMLLPLYYESPEADYWQLINNVTIWDVAVERQVEIMGPDAFHLVRLLTPRNLANCKIGQGKYVPVIDEQGGMINDPVLLRLGENHFWLSLADSDTLLWAKGVAHGLGLNVTLREPDVSPLAIQGPNAEAVTAALLGDWVKAINFFWFREAELDGIPLIVARSGWSKQGGFELYLRNGRFGTELWERVLEAGKPWNITPAAPSGIERIESGLLSYGNDMTLANNPLEIGLEKYCDLDQEFEFIGKAALQKIHAEGIKQKLVGLFIGGEPLSSPSNLWPVAEGGHVSSAAYSPRLKRNLALAMLPIELCEQETAVAVQTPNGPRSATVTTLPFI